MSLEEIEARLRQIDDEIRVAFRQEGKPGPEGASAPGRFVRLCLERSRLQTVARTERDRLPRSLDEIETRLREIESVDLPRAIRRSRAGDCEFGEELHLHAEQHRLRTAASAERARIQAAERARGRTAFEYGVWS